MKKLFLSALAILVMTASALTLRTTRTTPNNAAAALTADAAYRDGLYQGKLAAEAGNPYHALTGRWANTQDRASFAAGYDQGYNTTALNRAQR